MLQSVEAFAFFQCLFIHIESLVHLYHYRMITDGNSKGLAVGEGIVDSYFVAKRLEMLNDASQYILVGARLIVVVSYTYIYIRWVGA